MNRDIPFVPSSLERVATIFELIEVTPGVKSVDLGSGDGRVVIEFAKRGASAYGFEVDPTLVEKANENIIDAGVAERAIIHNQNFWEINLEEFDIITIYGITGIMRRLEEKLENELRNDALFVSNGFRLPNWEPFEKRNSIYIYKK